MACDLVAEGARSSSSGAEPGSSGAAVAYCIVLHFVRKVAA
jgi:hypothetical protein